MRIYRKAILPVGFKANAVVCGIKKSGKSDLALFYSDLPAKAACLFTANSIQAAPLQISKRYLKSNKLFKAIVVNSGNANSFTGALGVKDAWETTRLAAGALGIPRETVLIASTGIIGRRLEVNKIKKALPALAAGLSVKGIDNAKRAIMTTDTFTKEITVTSRIGGKVVTICGVAKGAGMIAPDMATMLCFILTDANIKQAALNRSLRLCTDKSFNCITVDGCMSTNDSVMMLANSASGNVLIDRGKNFTLFLEALQAVCLGLAKMIVRDAEGSTKFIEIKVNDAKDFQEARKIALNIANSSLFKTAMFGENPNFGRIASSVGASGADVREKDLKIKVSPLNKKEIRVSVSVGRGACSAVVYTSDLTPEYVRINAEYN